MTLAELRANKAAAYIAPLAVFMGLMLLSDLPGLEWKHSAAPWWRQQPQQWVYPLQTLVGLGLIAFWWRRYSFRPLGAKAWAWGVGGGVVGIALWILPAWWHVRTGQTISWLGVVDRSEPGFNPDIFTPGSAAWWTAVVLRFVRMTILVAIIEELFWRGFLWRYFATPDGRWEAVPIGVKHWRAIALTSVLMMVAHQPSDYAVCLVWSLMVSVVAIQTRSLGACVIMHAVSNFLLGLYIMTTKQWGLW
ncbi:MAG: CAAX prenyl protease-related protein [Verrucomicrobiales bacterium]